MMPDGSAHGIIIRHLRAWRSFRALSQAELADASGVGRTTILRAERAEPIHYGNVRKIAQALRVTVEQLQTELPPGPAGEAP